MKSKYFYILGSVLLLMFYLFSREVKGGFLKKVDFDTTVKVQERIDTSSRLRLASIVGDVMEGTTFFASPEVSVGAIILLTLFAFSKIKLRAFVIPILFGLLVMGEIYGKNVVHHPSPPFFMIKNPSTIFPKYYINNDFSYPSGHASRAVFMSFLIWLFIQRKMWLGIMLAIYVFAVSISRIYLGHHWLSDILGGALLGGGLGLLTAGLISPIIDKQ